MTQPNRYDIGYGPLKGPDLAGAADKGANGTVALGVTQCTVSPGLPTTRGRRPGDQHVDNSDPKGLLEYVLTGELGAGYQDDFNRPDSTYINSPTHNVSGWVQYPAGIDDAWYIISNAARARGEYRMLSRPFGPVNKTVVQTGVGAGSTGAPGVYAYSLVKGGQYHGYFFQVRVGVSGDNVFLKRGSTIVQRINTGAVISAPCILTLTVDKTTKLIAGAVNGVEVVTYTDPNIADATGGYVGIGSGAGTGDAFFDYFLVEEPGKNLQWVPISAPLPFSVTAPPQVNYAGSVTGVLETIARGDHTHKSVQFAYDHLVVP